MLLGRRGRPLRALVLVLCLALSGCVGSPPPPGTTEGASSSQTRDQRATRTPTPEESAAAASAALEERVTRALDQLDRRQQVAQLFVVGVPLDDLATGDALVRDSAVGGVFLRGRSGAGVPALAATTARWNSLAPGPRPWVAADQEGGAVQTLSGEGFAALPPAVDQGLLPPDQRAALADALGASLAGAGVNLDLAPVADVVPAGTEWGNPPIGASGRQYGASADVVTAAAGSIIGGLGAHGVTATLKHFPGLGLVSENTDTTPGVTDTATSRDGPQVAVFGELARSPHRPFVMLSSATYAQMDASAPAVFSKVVVTDVLRGQLRFDGVVISDDLGAARAVQAVPPGERAVRFLAAGGTLVLTVDATVLPQMIEAVLAQAAADPAYSAAVDAAVRTALLAKARSGLA
jgi:beta-glucosidase-like glycosyl hydrolase